MNIDIKITHIDPKHECTGMTCFEAPEYIRKQINNYKRITGVITINQEPIPFSFNPYFMDGDIFTTNYKYRFIVKHLVPLYLYNTLT